MHLPDSVIVVTGASRGIGAATAKLLAARGATVVCVGRDGPALARLADACRGSALVEDVSDPCSAERIVTETVARHGRLDAVVANAGIGYAGDFATMPTDRLTELVDVNIRAPLLLARAAVPAILAAPETPGTRGAILFVSSIAGAVGVPGESVYSATKAAIEAFATVLREELRADGISVSTVLPGVVDTGFFETRGQSYDRRFPRPMPVARIAQVIVNTLEDGRPRAIEPRWLAIPARLSTAAPTLYRTLARRFS